MALLIDTSVLVKLERSGWKLEDLARQLGTIEPLSIAAISASELLFGVHRADTAARRRRRLASVEEILGNVPTLPFDLDVARVHSELWAGLVAMGRMIPAHDLLIAATAIAYDCDVVTADSTHFSNVPRLRVRIANW
ncbi:MAG TPA: PIN domain-containing protein [Dehalococcoidia bacterium]